MPLGFLPSPPEPEVGGGGAGPWYVYECIPLLKNLAGFDKDKRHNILTQFIKHQNKHAVAAVQSFIQVKHPSKVSILRLKTSNFDQMFGSCEGPQQGAGVCKLSTKYCSQN